MTSTIFEFFRRYLRPGTDTGTVAPASTGAGPPGQDPVALAACALMLELAHADAEFTDAERRHIEDAIARHFNLAPDVALELIALAEDERRSAVDLYQFTSLIASHYDEGQRMVLAEVMWGLVYADGELAAHESYIMRKLSNLLDLRPGYLAEAKRRAMSAGAD